MSLKKRIFLKTGVFFAWLLLSCVYASSTLERFQMSEEKKLSQFVASLLEKYCETQCVLLKASIEVENPLLTSFIPGFDETLENTPLPLKVKHGEVKLLLSDLLPDTVRASTLKMLDKYTESLGYPVKWDVSVSAFPIAKEVQAKAAALQSNIARRFQDQLQGFLSQFCPKKCMLADFKIRTNLSALPAEMAEPGVHFAQDNVQLEVKEIGATILFDESLPAQDQARILDLARSRVSDFKNSYLSTKTIHFPQLEKDSENGGRNSSQYHSVAQNAVDSVQPGNLNTTSTNSDIKQNKEVSENKIESKTENRSQSETKKEVRAEQQTLQSQQKSVAETSEKSNRVERFERVEKIDRVENGDAVSAELRTLKGYGLVLTACLFAILTFIAFAVLKRTPGEATLKPTTQQPADNDEESSSPMVAKSTFTKSEPIASTRFAIEQLKDELLNVFIQNPKVTRHVFGAVLTESGIEVAAQYLHIFGEHVFLDLLKDATLQTDLTSLAQYYAKASIVLTPEEELNLLQRLQHRVTSAKLLVMGNQSSALFDFLSEMDPIQILEMMRGEADVVKAVVMTQCDTQKRAQVFRFLDSATQLNLMSHLSQIDHLPRSYIFNIASALKRKKKENPKLNTEALPGSEVLVSLLETTNIDLQKTVIRSLEAGSPDSTRFVLGRLVSINTLRYLKDGQVLEVIMSLKHDELIAFLKGLPQELSQLLLQRAPQDIASDLQEEVAYTTNVSKEAYEMAERKVLNKMKLMANEGQLNLFEANERMFGNQDMRSMPPDLKGEKT